MKKILSAFEKRTATPPIWLMRQAGRYLPEYREIRKDQLDFLSMCYNSELATEITLQPIKRFSFDAAILFSDILVIPDALGVDVKFVKGDGPLLEKITTEKIDNLKLDNIEHHLKPVFQAVSNIKAKLDDKTALIGFSGSSWTLAVYMIEGKSSKNFVMSKEFAYNNEKSFAKLLDILVEAISNYLILQIKAGAEIVQLFDSWSGVLTESQFREWVINPTTKIVANIKKAYPEIKIIGFPKGPSLMIEEYVRDTNVDAIAIDYTTPISYGVDIAKKYDKLLQGNLDPALLLVDDKSLLEKEIDLILKATSEIKHIFNLGHGIVPESRIENVEFLIEKIRKSNN